MSTRTSITEILLPEGMCMLAFTVTEHPGKAVLLAEHTHEGGAGWVTCVIFENSEVPGRWENCTWEHHFDELEFAWNDFASRAMIEPEPLRRIEP